MWRHEKCDILIGDNCFQIIFTDLESIANDHWTSSIIPLLRLIHKKSIIPKARHGKNNVYWRLLDYRYTIQDELTKRYFQNVSGHRKTTNLPSIKNLLRDKRSYTRVKWVYTLDIFIYILRNRLLKSEI